jgi:hypothetical protein
MSALFLAAHLHETSIQVIDVDEDTTAYDKGHIPGSIGWNWGQRPSHRSAATTSTGPGELLAHSGVAVHEGRPIRRQQPLVDGNPAEQAPPAAAAITLVTNATGDFLNWGVVVPLYAVAILTTRALPRWIG